MGRMVDGVWHTDERVSPAGDGRFHRAETSFRNWITPDGAPGPERRRRLRGRARPLSPLCLVGLPVGASHADLPHAQEARPADRHQLRRTADGRRRLDLQRAPAGRISAAAPGSTRSTPRRGPTIPAGPPCRCCGTRSATRSSRTNSSEIIRMFNSAFDGVGGDASRDYYPEPLARRDRPAQRRHLCDGQQRRLSLRLRRHAGGLRRGGGRPLRDPRHARAAACHQPLPDRRAPDRGGLAPLPDPLPLRRHLRHALQVQSQADQRLSEPLGLSARALPDAGHRRTTDLADARTHYFTSHRSINPRGIVPIGPEIDLTSPHGRERLRAA